MDTTKHTECPERDIRAPLDHPVPPDAPVAFAELLSREVPALALPQWMDPDFAAPAMPTLDVLLEGLSAPEWLRRAYTEMADIPVPFRRAAAMGLVARLWEPTTARDRATLREWLRAGRGTVASRVKDWLAESPETVTFGDRDDFIADVRDAADRLLDRLEYARDCAETREFDSLVSYADLARQERDDLASVRAVLWMMGEKEAVSDLDDALSVTDRMGWLHRSMLDHATAARAIAARPSRPVAADAPDGPDALAIAEADAVTDRIAEREVRFVAVAADDPSAWWGLREKTT